MRKLICIALYTVLLFPAATKAQEAMSFEVILTPGDSLREAGDMIGAIDAYKKSIAPGNKYTAPDQSVERSTYFADMYNLACAFSRTGQQDSALKYLERFTIESRDSVGEALSDPDFINIRDAAGWSKLEDQIIKCYCGKSKTTIKDIGYAKKLWQMGAIDQAYYEDIDIAERKTGKTSSVVMALWDLKRKQNEENQQQLESLIKEKGWPKISEVGPNLGTTAFLVIQHANLDKQQKYLPVIESFCKNGEARWQDYALMYDRIQVSIGKTQRYGSQVHYNNQTERYELLPLENPDKVDEWRKAIGLQPLSTYLANWSIVWPESK